MAGRDQAGPLITFYAPGGRTFQRIFRDASLSETKAVVRRKLKLPVTEEIRLERIENERRIDLDDDDDFDAFRVAARSKATAEVAVIFNSPSSTVGPSVRSAQPLARLSSGPQPETSNPLAGVRRRRPRASMPLPGNDAVSSGARVPSTQVEPSSTIRADVIHSPPPSGAHRADTQHTETERPRKKRKKLKHDSSIYDLTKGRSASNPPPQYVTPTPDPLASSPGPLAVQTTSQISSTGVPTNIMNDSEASANRDSRKKRKRKSIIEHDVAADPDPGVVVATASSPIDFVPPMRESPVHVPKQRRGNPRLISRSLTSDAARTTALSLHVEDAPPADLPSKKRKMEKVQSGAVDPAQPSSEDCPDKGVQPEVKKSKSKKSKKTEGRTWGVDVVQADGTQEQTAGPPSAEPVKRSKKAKHAEALNPSADVQAIPDATPEVTVADDVPVVVETGKKKDKKKTKKKIKDVDESATRSVEAASAVIPATTSEPIDYEKVVANAMTAIKAKRNRPSKSDMVAAGADAPQAYASHAEEGTSTAPEAGPSGLNVESAPINKERRKSKKAKVTAEEAQPEPATSTTETTVAKPKGKKRKSDDPVAGASDAAPPSTKTEADKSDLWKAVQAATLAAMSRRLSATPAQPAVAHQLPSTSVPQPNAAQEEVSEASAKTKKSRKEKGTKWKPTVPELSVSAETSDASPVDSVVPHSSAETSVTVVERQQPTRKRKSKATSVDASTTDATDHAHEYAGRVPSDVTPIHASATVDEPATGTSKLIKVGPGRPLPPRSPWLFDSSRASPGPTSHLLQNVLNSSPPRPPVGSDMDEVAVQERGEGSSDESSSGDEGSDEVSAPDLSHVDVEALLRGPAPRKSVLEELPSDSEEEDSEGEKQSEASDDAEEEFRLDKKYRRMSKRFQREGSSSDGEVDEVVAATFMDVDQETLEGQVDARNTPTVVQADQVPVTAESGASTSGAPHDDQAREDLDKQESVLPRSVDATARPVSPTVSMLEEDHRKDSERHVSTQISEQDEDQPSHEEESDSLKPGQNESASQEGTGAGDSSSAITPVELDTTSTSSRLKSPPLSAIQTVIGEQPDDPIEPAEDFIIPESPRIDEIDPIEPDSPVPQPAPERQHSTPPPLPSSRPGTVRRMKNREGKVGTPRPVLASELPIPVPSFAELDHEDSPPSPTRKATKRTTSATSMPPPPDPEPTQTPASEEPAPKRRGRPPIPQEEKDRRLAEKKAEKERLAAERKAKREADKAAKEAEKERLRGEKATSKRGGRAARAGKVAKPAPVVESEDEDEQPVAPTNQTPNAAGKSQRPGWTALQTPQTQEGSVAEGESMMIDELRSSSPAHSSPLATGLEKTPRLSIATGEDTIESPGNAAQPHVGSSQPQAESQTPQKVAIPSSDPLFLPGSSQVPYTPFAGTQPAAHSAASPAASSSGSSDSDSEPIAQRASLHLQRTRPWMKFRGLSDLASQAMFTPPSILSLTASAKKDVPEKGRKQDDDDEDEDSDEDEDEEDEDEGQERKSHIPENRRAGAGVQQKRASGLASFAK